jgi:hypothetical protein
MSDTTARFYINSDDRKIFTQIAEEAAEKALDLVGYQAKVKAIFVVVAETDKEYIEIEIVDID